MNIKDLQPGSYKTIDQPVSNEPKLNVNNLNTGSYKVISGGENIQAKPFKYDIQETPVTREEKIKQYQSEAEASAKEAKKANSFGGFMKNFGSSLVENLAPSETGLGKTMGKTFSKGNLDIYTKNVSDLTNSNITLQKLIKEKESRGEDATSLKRSYNSNVDLIEENKKNIDEYNKDLPSTGKVLGQLGGTALDVLTAGTYGKATKSMQAGKLFTKSTKPVVSKVATTVSPELGKIAEQTPKGLFSKKGALNVAKSAGIGYGFDVTQGLQGNRGENREGAGAFVPGLGTLVGTMIPLASETNQTIKNMKNPDIKAGNLSNKRYAELNKIDEGYKILKTASSKGKERGIDVKRILSDTDVLHGSVDKTGTITTKGEGGAVQQYTKEFIDGNESIVSDLLKKEGRSVSPDLVKKKLKDAVMASNIQGQALKNALNKIDDEVQGYALRSGNNGLIPVEVLHNAKVDKYNNINFFTESNTKAYDKTIAKALKTMVEENTTSADISKINKELSKHYAVIDYLNKLDGKKVEGGRLGKYFAKTVGAIVGSHFGPLGSIVGAEAGGAVKGGMMSRVFSGKTGKVIPQAEVIADAIKIKNEPAIQLPAQSSKSLGSLNIAQSKNTINTNPSIENIIPVTEQEVKTFQSLKSLQEQKKYVADKLYGEGAKTKGKEADIVLGLPASGKSKIFSDRLLQERGAMLVDADEAKKVLMSLEENKGQTASQLHPTSGDIVENTLIKKGAMGGDNMVIPMVGKNTTKIQGLIDYLHAKGYKVNLHLSEITNESAVSRATARAGETGQNVPVEYIRSLGNSPSATFDKLINNPSNKTKITAFNAFSNEVPMGQSPALKDTSSPSFVFVSPNKKTGTSIDDALNFLDTDNQMQGHTLLQSKINENNIPGNVSDSIGVWSDGAENSLNFKDGDLPTEKLRLLGAEVAKPLGQKQYIWFKTTGEKTGDMMHEISIDKNANIAELSKSLSDAGIDFKTISGDSIVIFNKRGDYFDGNLFKKISTFMNNNSIASDKWKWYYGTGEFEGSFLEGEQARSDAQKIYGNIIKNKGK